jgi:hypothetical protein
MKTFKLLLAHSDRRISNLTEALLRTITRDRAILDCTRVEGMAEFVDAAVQGDFDLIIVGPKHSGSLGGAESFTASFSQGMAAIRMVKTFGRPTMAIGVPLKDELRVSEAGANVVLEKFNCRELTSAIERFCFLPPPASIGVQRLTALWKRVTLRLNAPLRRGKPTFGSYSGTAL